MSGPTVAFWQEHFEADRIPWDRGAPGPQLVDWLGDRIHAGQRVLVPGCGSGWDVAALAASGVATTGIDYTAGAVARTRKLLASRGLSAEVVEADVLAWSPPEPVDAVYEQTCLCALHPDHWTRYAAQLHRWIVPGGLLLALFMQKPRPGAAEGFVEGPPFHGDVNAMRALFPADRWDWPKPPYRNVPHPSGMFELAVPLVRRPNP